MENNKEQFNAISDELVIRSSGALSPTDIIKSGDLDFFYKIKNEAKKLSTINNKLGIYENSDDKFIINELNKDNNLENIINGFTNEEEEKKKTFLAKQIVINILNKIKSNEFRETEIGNIIYSDYIKFITNVNIQYLENFKKFDYNPDILTNSILYLTLGVDDFSTLNELCKEINNITRLTNVNLVPQLTSSEKIIELSDEAREKIKESLEKSNKEIDDIEKSKSSYFNKAMGFLSLGLFSNKTLRNLQKIAIIGCASWGFKIFIAPIVIDQIGKLITGDLFSQTKSLDKLLDIEKIETVKEEKVEKKPEEKTIYKAIVELIIAKANSYKK